MKNLPQKLIDLVKDPLRFYSSDQLLSLGFGESDLKRLERDDFKLARVSSGGNFSYLGGYLLGMAQRDRLGIRNLLRKKPKSYSYVCPFSFCRILEVHTDELPESILVEGKPLPLIQRVQIRDEMQLRIPVSSMAYLSLPVVEDIPIDQMTNEDLVRKHRVSGDKKYKEEFLTRYTPAIMSMIDRCASFHVAIEQMGYEVLLNPAKEGANDGFDRFDLTRGILLTTYLDRRVRGEVLDFLREVDEVPRTVRTAEKKMRTFIKTAEAAGKLFDIKDFVLKTGISIDTAELAYELFQKNQSSRISLDKRRTETEGGKEVTLKDDLIVEVPASRDPLKLFVLRDGISALLRGMDSIEREVIVAYFLGNSSMREIAESLDLSESRVSQMINGSSEKCGKDGILFRLRERAAQIFPEYVPSGLRFLISDE